MNIKLNIHTTVTPTPVAMNGHLIIGVTLALCCALVGYFAETKTKPTESTKTDNSLCDGDVSTVCNLNGDNQRQTCRLTGEGQTTKIDKCQPSDTHQEPAGDPEPTDNPCLTDNGGCLNDGECKYLNVGSNDCKCARGYTGNKCQTSTDTLDKQRVKSRAECLERVGSDHFCVESSANREKYIIAEKTALQNCENDQDAPQGDDGKALNQIYCIYNGKPLPYNERLPETYGHHWDCSGMSKNIQTDSAGCVTCKPREAKDRPWDPTTEPPCKKEMDTCNFNKDKLEQQAELCENQISETNILVYQSVQVCAEDAFKTDSGTMEAMSGCAIRACQKIAKTFARSPKNPFTGYDTSCDNACSGEKVVENSCTSVYGKQTKETEKFFNNATAARQALKKAEAELLTQNCQNQIEELCFNNYKQYEWNPHFGYTGFSICKEKANFGDCNFPFTNPTNKQIDPDTGQRKDILNELYKHPFKTFGRQYTIDDEPNAALECIWAAFQKSKPAALKLMSPMPDDSGNYYNFWEYGDKDGREFEKKAYAINHTNWAMCTCDRSIPPVYEKNNKCFGDYFVSSKFLETLAQEMTDKNKWPENRSLHECDGLPSPACQFRQNNFDAKYWRTHAQELGHADLPDQRHKNCTLRYAPASDDIGNEEIISTCTQECLDQTLCVREMLFYYKSPEKCTDTQHDSAEKNATYCLGPKGRQKNDVTINTNYDMFDGGREADRQGSPYCCPGRNSSHGIHHKNAADGMMFGSCRYDGCTSSQEKPLYCAAFIEHEPAFMCLPLNTEVRPENSDLQFDGMFPGEMVTCAKIVADSSLTNSNPEWFSSVFGDGAANGDRVVYDCTTDQAGSGSGFDA